MPSSVERNTLVLLLAAAAAAAAAATTATTTISTTTKTRTTDNNSRKVLGKQLTEYLMHSSRLDNVCHSIFIFSFAMTSVVWMLRNPEHGAGNDQTCGIPFIRIKHSDDVMLVTLQRQTSRVWRILHLLFTVNNTIICNAHKVEYRTSNLRRGLTDTKITQKHTHKDNYVYRSNIIHKM